MVLPIVSAINKEVLRYILSALSKSTVMEAFILNTALRKASEAKDYVDAVKLKDSLPDDVSDEEYEKHERKEMDAFVAFVTVG